MWNKNSKTVFLNFLPYECEAAEEYLEAMAEKGWLLQSIRGVFLKFKKIEPQKIKYTVDVLHKISEFDHKDSDIALEYREYCQEAGWKYICEKGKVQVFYTEDCENTIPIHTDGEEKLKSVIKASLANVATQFFLTLLLIFNLYMQLFMGNVDYTLSSNLGIFSALTMLTVISINIIEITSFFIWTVRARIHLKYNEFMPYNSSKQVRIKNMLKAIFVVVILLILSQSQLLNNQDYKFPSASFIIVAVIVFIPSVIFMLLRNYTSKKKYSKNTNLALYALSFILSTYLLVGFTGFLVLRNFIGAEESTALTGKAPLTLEDFGYSANTYENEYMKIDKSILASRINYSCGNQDNDITYTILGSQYPLVIKFDQNREISRFTKYGFDLTEIKNKLPENIKVYRTSKYNTFVLVSEDKVVTIRKGFSKVDDEKFLNMVYSRIFIN